MKQKYLAIFLLAGLLCACSSGKAGTMKSSESVAIGGSSGSMEIISRYHSDSSLLQANGEDIEPEEFLRIFQYARKTANGVEMIYLDSTFLSGRLLYEINNARIAHSLQEMDAPADGFSPDICAMGKDGILMRPDWIAEDGSFQEHSVILVDVSVTNDNAKQRTEMDKMGNETDPYTFSATQFLFLCDPSIKPGGPYSNYNTIRYFSALQKDVDHAYSFRLLPGESIEFTLGFVLGRPESRFNSAKGLVLSNVSGSSDGIQIAPGLED